MELDDYGLEVLTADQCRALLATRRVGRIGTSIDALPVVVPVNYAVDGTFICVRTRPDTAFDKAVVGCVVCFEVDNLDESGEYLWGVNVSGVAQGVYADAEIERLEAFGVPELIFDSHWVRIPTNVVVGRRRSPDNG